MPLIDYAICAFCLVGCGIVSFKLGRLEGIEHTVQYFINVGVLEVEEEE